MPLPRISAIQRPLRAGLRVTTVYLCALGYLAAMLGAPIPVPSTASSVRQQTSAQFPCSGHRCGCQTEEQCRRHCCCFSDAQRVAWYRQHALEIPTELRGSPVVQHEPAGKGCCKSRPSKSDSVDGGLLLVRALRCQGQGTYWLSVGAVLPVLPVEQWEQQLDAGERLCEAQPFLLTCALAPPVPPPRIAA